MYSPFELYFGCKPPTLAEAALEDCSKAEIGLDYKQFLSPEEWLRNMEVACRDALILTNHARMVTANE